MKAFIFTGQGSEYSQMAKKIYEENEYAKKVIDNLNISFNFKKIFIYENTKVNDTRYAQIGNFVISSILAKLLNKKGIFPNAVAGLSLGEYTSICYANILTFEEILQILEVRSRIMYNALINKNTGMLAVINLEVEKIKCIMNKFKNISIANYNSIDQTIVAGDIKELESFEKLLLNEGARKIVKLDVIGAFHTSYLKNESKELNKKLIEYSFKEETIPVYYNYLGNKQEIKKYDIHTLLTYQLYNPVKFSEIILNMLKDGIDEFYVIGIGKTVATFIRSIAIKYKYKIKIYILEKIEDLEKF